jgi:TolA-binding protein
LHKAAELAYSLKEYERAIAWYGMVEGADFDVGRVYFDIGRYEKAVGSFKAFIKKFPMNKRAEEAQFLVGVAERRMEDFPASVEALDDLLKLYPSSDYVYNATILIGDNCFDMGRYNDALASYRKALTLLPQPLPRDAILAINGIIDAEYRAGGLESALSLASSYAKTNSHISDEIYLKIGDLTYQEAQYKRAAEYYNAVKSQKLLPRALYWQGMSYYSLGNEQKAEEVFIRISRELPKEEAAKKALLILSDIYIGRGDFEKAKECLLKANNDETMGMQKEFWKTL